MDRTELNAQIAQIKNATSIGENTAERIGTVLESFAALIFDEAFQGTSFCGSQTAKISEVNNWLDNVSFVNTEANLKKIGRCKLFSEGANIEVYNFVLSFASAEGSQLAFGNIAPTNNGAAITISGSQFNILYRIKNKGAWGKWMNVAGTTTAQVARIE